MHFLLDSSAQFDIILIETIKKGRKFQNMNNNQNNASIVDDLNIRFDRYDYWSGYTTSGKSRYTPRYSLDARSHIILWQGSVDFSEFMLRTEALLEKKHPNASLCSEESFWSKSQRMREKGILLRELKKTSEKERENQKLAQLALSLLATS
jgi:hypothetical protein